MKVSIISGVYNAEKYLYDCINSMLQQTYKNIEIILVVNASTDASTSIVKKFEKEEPEYIKAFYIEDKLGAGGSRQYGMQYATGDFVCFVDCDDELEPNYIKNMMNVVLRGGVNTDIVICNFKKVDTSGKVLYKRRYKNKNQALVQSVAPWGKMFRMKYLKQNKLVLRNIPFGEDVLFAAELYLTNPIVNLCDYYGYIWRDNPKSVSHTELGGFPKGTVTAAITYLDYMEQRYSDKMKYLSYFRYKYFVWYLLQSGRNVTKAAMLNEYNKSFSYLYKANINWNRFNKDIKVSLKGERLIVTIVLLIIRIFEKLNISRSFFLYYSQSFLGKFWPSL